MEPVSFVPFLRRIHLFRGLEDEQIASIAGKLRERVCEAGEVIFREGEQGNTLFLVYEGQVEVDYRRGKKTYRLALLTNGDYFGEEAALKGEGYYAETAIALSPTRLLYLSHRDLMALLRIIPRLKTNLEVVISSRRLARQVVFHWLGNDEDVLFLARKHPVRLWGTLARPLVMGIILGILIGAVYLVSPASWLLVIAGTGWLLLLIWGWWQYLDWHNDYYVVTNQRVVWCKKVMGLYESRQEAPLSAILSVGVETSQLGRMWGFGGVIIRTFLGKIIFNDVHRPYEAASLIEEHWTRLREATHKMDFDAMRRVIRQKLGLETPPPLPAAGSTPGVASSPRPARHPKWLLYALKLRLEETDGIVTYRKHYFVLFRQTALASLLSLVSLSLLIYSVTHLSSPAVSAGLVPISLIGLGTGFFWWLYQYVDWRNDRFQVTQDQIFDIDRKPFGREERKVASLDNILNTESRRETLLQMLFNYGNVYIAVGSTQMVFENVANPSRVQQDIDERRLARLERKRRAEAEVERERMADWVVAYHQTMRGSRSSQFPPPSPEPEEDNRS